MSDPASGGTAPDRLADEGPPTSEDGAVARYAGLMGLSRVWLSVHRPGDVTGGWLFGVGSAASVAAALTALRRSRPDRDG